MPPKTRGTKTSKASKENAGVVNKTKLKGVTKATRPRKALADKTNSASDDNASSENLKKVAKKTATKAVFNDDNNKRPRRERRLPDRFVENQVLTSLTNSKEVEIVSPEHTKSKSLENNDSTILSPFKTPEKDADNSLIANRPRRVCRLPSKFDDHSVSPNKFIPVGCHASTPILQSKVKTNNVKAIEKVPSQKVVKQSKIVEKKPVESSVKAKNSKKSPVKDPVSPVKKPVSPVKKPIVKAKADSNNNANQRVLRKQLTNKELKSTEKCSPIKNIGPKKPSSPKKASSVKSATDQKLLEKSFSFRVLVDKKKSLKRDNSHLDVYEFTYDPNEEPPPQKKKKKKVVRKKPAKPKPVVFKNNYDQNINKALAALKNVVSKNPQSKNTNNVQNNPQNGHEPQTTKTNALKESEKNLQSAVSSGAQDKNYVSIGIEDIAADIEPMDHHEINYSPVTSPNRCNPMPPSRDHSIERQYQDPLNLQDCLSFFDEPPVASSSMNMSTRRPQDTPWRVQFEQLPIKWHVNTYVKPNMTPAVESSFINFDDSKKKHIYTNMVPEANDDLPEIVENNQSNLKQTSIMSFIKEVVERSASKKKRAKSITPVKANSIFEDLSNISVTTNRDAYRTPRKTPAREIPENSTPNRIEENEFNDYVENKENSSENKKSKKKSVKSANKEKDKDGTFFGFDESEDQENVSPVKIDNPRVRALRPRARAVLQEINAETGPTRAKLPLAAKTAVTASSEAVNKVYEDLKSAADAPVFPEKNLEAVAATEVNEQMNLANEDDDSQSVHLFEDIDVVHHLQPSRKSYGKATKKVAFQATNSDSETQINPLLQAESGDEDDLADLTFTLPSEVHQKTRPKKKTKKKDNLSKKEKAELDAWAAGFNSMCEDIEDFPLMVE